MNANSKSQIDEPLQDAARSLLVAAKHTLDAARLHGDPLQIDLAEAAMNDVLDTYLSQLSRVTSV